MGFSEFLNELFAEGRVAVARPAPLDAEEAAAAIEVLEAQEQIVRLDLPAGAPEFGRTAGLAAATQFYRACQIAMFRDVGEEAIAELAKENIDGWERAAVHYSIDLTFRFLPDLVRIARTLATDDPLVNLLLGWARRWPLSSVGIVDVGDELQLGPIIESNALLTMYVDRIVSRGDRERVQCEPVRIAVRRALGLYDNLAPTLVTAMQHESEGLNEQR